MNKRPVSNFFIVLALVQPFAVFLGYPPERAMITALALIAVELAVMWANP